MDTSTRERLKDQFAQAVAQCEERRVDPATLAAVLQSFLADAGPIEIGLIGLWYEIGNTVDWLPKEFVSRFSEAARTRGWDRHSTGAIRGTYVFSRGNDHLVLPMLDAPVVDCARMSALFELGAGVTSLPRPIVGGKIRVGWRVTRALKLTGMSTENMERFELDSHPAHLKQRGRIVLASSLSGM